MLAMSWTSIGIWFSNMNFLCHLTWKNRWRRHNLHTVWVILHGRMMVYIYIFSISWPCLKKLGVTGPVPAAAGFLCNSSRYRGSLSLTTAARQGLPCSTSWLFPSVLSFPFCLQPARMSIVLIDSVTQPYFIALFCHDRYSFPNVTH